MSIRNQIAKRFRHLTDHEIQVYDLVPDWVAGRALLIRFPWIPGGYEGMTLGRLVLLTRDFDANGGSKLIAHELVHVRQYMQYGKLGFGRRYLNDFFSVLIRTGRWKVAYRAIGFEREAYDCANQWSSDRA